MGYPGAPNQSPQESYSESASGGNFFDKALDFAERGTALYGSVRKISNPNPSAPAKPEGGSDGKTIAEQIAEAVSNAIPDSVVDAASKQGEQRYFESLNTRYNPGNIVGKGAAAVAVAIGAFWVAKKLRVL